MEVTNDMLGDILAESGGQYFYHKEDTGEVTLVFQSGIKCVEPGEEDSAGRIWNPPTTDAQGNPLLDFNGNPREVWAKFEAEVLINGAPHIYGFSGKRSAVLKNFIMAMKTNDIGNDQLPGTKWSIDRVGRWDWVIKYLGKEGDKPVPSTPTPATNKKSSW